MAFPPPPAGLDLTESRQPTILGVSISTFILASTAVGLRVFCRRTLGLKLWWDDWMVFVALASGAGMLFMVNCYMVPHGLGKHVWAGPPDATQVWAHGLFIEEILYTICLTTIKYSILLFYWRLFNRGKIRIGIYILAGVVTGWGIAVVFTSIFQCIPPHAMWDRFNPNVSPETKAGFRCDVDAQKFFIGNSVANFVTDIAILTLPIPSIWALQLPTSKKIAVLSILMLGVFIVVVSIVRFYFVVILDLQAPDITWNFVEGQYWSNVECYIAITCACLPSLGPLFSWMTGGSLRSKGQSGSSFRMEAGAARKKAPWKSDSSSYQELQPTKQSYNHSTSAYSTTPDGIRGDDMMAGNQLQRNLDLERGVGNKNDGIIVKTDVSVERYR